MLSFVVVVVNVVVSHINSHNQVRGHKNTPPGGKRAQTKTKVVPAYIIAEATHAPAKMEIKYIGKTDPHDVFNSFEYGASLSHYCHLARRKTNAEPRPCCT